MVGIQTHRRKAPTSRSSCSGFTYLWVLIAVAIISIGLAEAAEVWATSARRQKLQELEWIGAQFTQAIGSYYYATPGPAKTYPNSLQDLISDSRFLTVRRHLRCIYANPFTGKKDWEFVVGSDGRTHGVRISVPGDEGPTVREFVYEPESTAQ